MKKSLALFLLSTVMIFIGCKNDAPVVEQQVLDGEWVVTSATRGSKVTRTVDGAIFNFDIEQQSMATDLLGSMRSSPFQIEDEYIVQEIPEIRYQIITQTDTSLQLAMTMKKTKFTFLLKRPEEEPKDLPNVEG